MTKTSKETIETVSPQQEEENNPLSFMDSYRESMNYTLAFDAFFRGKTLADDVSLSEQIASFEASEACRYSFIDYAQSTGSFRFDEDFYSQGALEAIQAYITQVKAIRDGQFTRGQLEDADIRRSVLHLIASQALKYDGIVPNDNLGRAMARLILIDKGLDTYESAKVATIKRVQRQV